MDEPVSAFVMYKANTTANKDKKHKKRNKLNKQPISPKPLPPQLADEKKQRELAQKLKKKTKKVKDSKNIIKKKQQKKKKSKQGRGDTNETPNKRSPKRRQPLVADNADDDDEEEVEEIPILVPAPNPRIVNGQDLTVDECSHSDDGSIEFTPVETDSAEEGLKVFKWMIAPYDKDDFFKNCWEKKPIHIARSNSNYYKEIITTPLIDNMLRHENIQFTKNIDVTSYVNGQRQTHNPEGRAHPHLVWDFYLNGCSVRLLNPQTYIQKLLLLNATMQEFFNSFVGANAYLTPPDSQGFAPHYDDIEAFILQTEGKKLWRIYKPLNEEEVLPRVSSENYSQKEIGRPILEVTLEAGDMLYFPRGYIHQGVTIDGEHSLHVTISMYQKHSWADLLEKLVPSALQIAINENVDLRKGLPLDLYDHFGLVHSDSKSARKQEINKIMLSLIDKLKKSLPSMMDAAVDQMHKDYQHAALPPVLNEMEKAVTVFGDSDVMTENGQIINRVELAPDTRIRLLRKNILRMVSEDKIRLYFHVENSLEYHGSDLPYIDIDEELAPGIETLITTYPEYVAVENLELRSIQERIHLADALWSRGLIMTEYPLENVEDD